MGGDRTERRMSLRQAAEVLGVSKDAVRQRVRRGTLRSEKGEDGRVYVYVVASEDDTADAVHSEGELTDELRDRIRYLERQVEEERDARRRADTLLAQLMQRIPELEAPAEPRESPETDAAPRPDTPVPSKAHEGGETRPWWRRIFGG